MVNDSVDVALAADNDGALVVDALGDKVEHVGDAATEGAGRGRAASC